MSEKKKSTANSTVNRPDWKHPAGLVKTVYLIIFAGVLLAAQAPVAGQSQLPGFRAPLLDEPATPYTFRSKVGQGSSGPGPSISDPEIKELARGLKYDPGLMYRFVHDYVRFYPMWGDVKGPYMTWMDRSGTGFDQASLMIALLKEAEQHCTEYTVVDPNYVVGEIQLTAEQFTDWFGIQDDAYEARELLARTGLYGYVSENVDDTIEYAKLEHVWLKVTIDGNDYEFDPSFKSHTTTGGLSSLAGAMGYNKNTFIDHAEQGSSSGSGWVKDVNKPNIASDLTSYSTNLISYIKTNYPDGDLRDIIGGRRIKPAPDNPLPPTTLPYTVLSRDDEFAIENTPNLYRSSLRIQHCGIDKTFFSSDIYGRRLTITYNGSNQPELRLDGTLIETGNATTVGQLYDLILDVNHPYESDDFDGTTTLEVAAGGFYFIVNGWGDTGTNILEKHRSLLEEYRHDPNLADDSEEVLGESYVLVGLTWLAQTSHMRCMAGEIGEYTVVNHHMLGVAGEYTAPYINMAAGHIGIAHEWKDTDEMFLAISGHAGAYEHEVIRQLQDCNAVSTVNLLEMANDRTTYDKIFEADDSNWNSIKSQLQGYSQDEKDDVNDYIDADFNVLLPQYGDLDEDDWTGMGFRAMLFTQSSLTASYVISGGYNGGSAGANTSLSPSEVVDKSYHASYAKGAYRYGHTDLIIGNGGLPFGLSFNRRYSSYRRLEDGSLGLGWTHNFDITAKVTSDPFQALGEDDSPIDAAAHIVSLFVTWDILSTYCEDRTRNMIASLCEAWLMDQMTDNLVTIKQGAQRLQFVKVPDGTYHAPPGQCLRLVTEGDGTFLLKNSNGIFYDFDSDGHMTEWSDAFGNVVEFMYTNGKLTDVVSRIGGSIASRSLSFSYDGDHISTVTDSAIRSVSFAYDSAGTLATYTNPDGNVTIYDYDDVNDGQLTEIYLPTDTNNPFITIVYDSLGRINRRIGAGDCCTSDYYLAYYRTEVLEPAQMDPNDPNGPPRRFSTVSWSGFDKWGNRRLVKIDQLGRKTTYEYDGEHKTTRVTDPSGTSKEYTYDTNHHSVITADSYTKPGSPPNDPNLYTDYWHDSYENSQGRWFVVQTKYSDPNGYETTREYDPDVGTLLKIIYPDPNTGEGGGGGSPALSEALDTDLSITTGSSGGWFSQSSIYYYDNDAAESGDIGDDYWSWMNSSVDGEGTVTFYWKVSSEEDYDYLQFYIDDVLQDEISGEVGWSYQSYNISGSGSHTLKWRYVKDDSESEGSDCGWVDYVQWTGSMPATPVVEFTYNAYGQLETKTDAEGMVTKFEYYSAADGAGLKKTIVDYDGAGHLNITTELTYDNVGNVATTKDPLGNITENEYYDSRLLKKTTDPCDYETSYEYYPDGNLKYVKRKISANEYVYLQAITYNAKRQKETVRGPYPQDPNSAELQVNYTQYAYDALGRLWKVTDAEGNVTETRYYPDRKVWKVIDAEGHTTITNTYDPNGYLLKVQDAKGNTTEYEYNGFMALKKTTYADGTYTERDYDHIRRMKTMRTRAGQRIEAGYDCLHRVKIKELWDVFDDPETITNTITYKYDLTGKVLETSDNTGTIKNTHDSAGRLIQVEYPDGKEVSYEYDAAGNRAKLTYPDGSYITYEYDQVNHLKKIRNDANTVLAKYTYDVRSRRQKVEYANGTSIDYEYDVASRLTSINNQTDTNHKYAYTYDDVGNRLSMLVNDSEEHIYDYDKIYQVTDVNYPTGYEYFVEDTTFNYDDAGNRTSAIDGGTENYVTNEMNQYSSVGGIWCDYDDNGNLTYDASCFYSYDAENRLTTVTSASGSVNGPLNIAVENTDLTFTTGGDANWVLATTEWFCDRDSAQSGDIADNQESWLETTVEHEGEITFWYKVSSESGDYFKFSVDGDVKKTISGDYDWTEYSYTIKRLGTHTLRWSYSKDGSGSSGEDCAWVDYVQWDGTTEVSESLQEALDVGWTIVSGGDAGWNLNGPGGYHDEDYAESKYISDNKVSQMEATVEGEGTVTFYWKVWSEEGDDFLQFYIDGVFKDQISGNVGWQQKSYNLTGSGSHRLLWQYTKDSSGSSGADRGYVDWLQGPGSAPPPPDPLAELAEAMDCDLSFTTGGDADWYRWSDPYYDRDCARSGGIDDEEETWMQTTVDVNDQEQETITFYWKVSSEEDCDYLQFYIDDVLKDEISGDEDWQQKIYTLDSGSHTLKWQYVKDGSDDDYDDRGYVVWLQAPGSTPPPPCLLAEALDCDLSIDSGGVDAWYPTSTAWYLDGNAARSSYISNGEESNLDTRVYVDGQETLTFYWKVSCEQNDDYLQFYVDGVLKDQISGEVDWQKKTYNVSGSGGHALKWRYVKDYSGSAGDDRGWVDFVQWTGRSPRPDPNDWQKITYKYDISGRRIEKNVDGYKTTYCYDGGHVLAEYDGNGNILRKYVYGGRVDEPVCMIEVADSNAAYYYHFDGLGSVVALSDSAGDTVQTYEYSIYGQVAASDPNHPNPYLFTGRRFDRETGLYYYRARYYNPYIGRFMQTDPVGYDDGINWYLYCNNNPLIWMDPSGLYKIRFYDCDSCGSGPGDLSNPYDACDCPWDPAKCGELCDKIRNKFNGECYTKCPIGASAGPTRIECLSIAVEAHWTCQMDCYECEKGARYPPTVYWIKYQNTIAACKAARGIGASDRSIILVGILMGLASLIGSSVRIWRDKWKKLAET